MERKKDIDNALKQALERRQVRNLPSNFSFRMMEKVRNEAVKQQKRKERILFGSMIAILLILIGLLIGYAVLYTNIQWSRVVPNWRSFEFSSAVWGFYLYIAALVSLLLGADYWLRRRRQKS